MLRNGIFAKLKIYKDHVIPKSNKIHLRFISKTGATFGEKICGGGRKVSWRVDAQRF
jgi:hypothetical protein